MVQFSTLRPLHGAALPPWVRAIHLKVRYGLWKAGDQTIETPPWHAWHLLCSLLPENNHPFDSLLYLPPYLCVWLYKVMNVGTLDTNIFCLCVLACFVLIYARNTLWIRIPCTKVVWILNLSSNQMLFDYNILLNHLLIFKLVSQLLLL